LQRLLRIAWEEQKRFPLQIATVLSQQFAGHGLQFFKVNKTITHVSVARPHYLDMETTPVSGQVKRIVELINATPKCTRRQLLATLAPTPAAAPAAAPAPAPVASPTGEAGAAPAAPSAPPTEPAPTPEQAAIIGDLHWLIHQGHVIEFANGTLETAKKPLVRPPKPPKPAAQPAASPEAAAAAGVAETAASGTTEAPAEAVVDTGIVPESPVGQPGPSMEPEAPAAVAEPLPEPPAEPATT
jgi:hypothetical protein